MSLGREFVAGFAPYKRNCRSCPSQQGSLSRRLIERSPGLFQNGAIRAHRYSAGFRPKSGIRWGIPINKSGLWSLLPTGLSAGAGGGFEEKKSLFVLFFAPSNLREA